MKNATKTTKKPTAKKPCGCPGNLAPGVHQAVCPGLAKKQRAYCAGVAKPTPPAGPQSIPAASGPAQKFAGTMSVADYLATVKTTDKQRETLERLKDKGKLW